MTRSTSAVTARLQDSMAYTARKGDKWFMVINGKEGPRYDGVAMAIFSPDSTRIAHMAVKDKKSSW